MTRTLAGLLLICASSACAQQVLSLDDARDIGLTMEHMDSLYKSAFNPQDSSDEAFPGRVEEFLERWPGTLRTIGKVLHEQGFRHPQDIRVVYRIFFGASGRIEHFHYALSEAIDPELEQRFRSGVQMFADTCVFPMQPNGPFRQCGSMVLQADPER